MATPAGKRRERAGDQVEVGRALARAETRNGWCEFDVGGDDVGDLDDLDWVVVSRHMCDPRSRAASGPVQSFRAAVRVLKSYNLRRVCLGILEYPEVICTCTCAP